MFVPPIPLTDHKRTDMTREAFAITIAMALLVVACTGSGDTDSSSEPSTTRAAAEGMYEGSDGVVSDISDTSRLIVLNGDITETIFALGAGGRVVARDLTTTYPPEAEALPDIGLYRTMTAESVIALDPSLVLGDEQVVTQSPEAVEQIRQAGIPVVILRTEVTLEGVSRKIREIGHILEIEDEAEELVMEVEAEIDEALALAAQATSTPRAAYMYVRGPETLLFFGTGMPTYFMLEAAGAVDVGAEAGVIFAEVLSAERLVTSAPEVLLTSEEGYEILGGLDAFLALPGVADTPAGKAGNVLAYDDALLLGMGPRVGQGLKLLVTGLHPELGS